MASFMHVAVSILLLSTLTLAQMRGDNSFAQDICNPNDGDDDGIYCSTTCGVLDKMEQDLEDLVNLTRGAQDKVVYLKDSETQAQKQEQDTYIKKSTSMLDDIMRFEKIFLFFIPLPSQLQSIVQANEKRIIDLKQMSVQLDQMCKEPCKDTAQIQTVTGKGKTSGLYYVKPARAPEALLVYCEIDSFGRGWTVLQRRRDGSVDFNKKWIQYKEGFGYLSPDDRTEFWLGNEKIYLLSVQSSVSYVLRIEMVDWDGNKKS
uniref:Fibrinogen gamma chain n=2 Tax=Cyprinus carpio TaxID=7962 RepID=A0A8C1E0Z4_CYPCA